MSSRHGDGADGRGKRLDDPSPTITADCHESLVASHLCVFQNNMDAKAMDEPLPTLTQALKFGEVRTYLCKIDTAQDLGNWDKVRRLLNDYAGYSIADDEILVLEIDGAQYFIYDVGMRMLKAEELKLAQGFPADYCIDIESKIGKPYSEAKQIARLGNAVCPPVATALVKANYIDVVAKPLVTMAALNKYMQKRMARRG